MPSSPTTPGNYIKCWNEAGKPADRFRAPTSWRTLPPLPSDTSIFRGSTVFRWSVIWIVCSRPRFLRRSPSAGNDLSTGNRYFWHGSVNTPQEDLCCASSSIALTDNLNEFEYRADNLSVLQLPRGGGRGAHHSAELLSCPWRWKGSHVHPLQQAKTRKHHMDGHLRYPTGVRRVRGRF